MWNKKTLYLSVLTLFCNLEMLNDIKAKEVFGAYGNYRGYSNLGFGIDFFNTEIGNPFLSINGTESNDIFAQNKYNDTIENKISFSPSLTTGIYIKPRLSFETTILHRYVSPTKLYSILHMPNNNKDVFYDGYSETSGYLGLAFHKPLSHKVRLSSGLSMGASAVKSSWGESIAPSVLVNGKIDYFLTKNISIYASASITGNVIKFNAKQETSNDILPTPFFNNDTLAKTLPKTGGSSYVPKLNILSGEIDELYKIKFAKSNGEEVDLNDIKFDNITINNLIALDNAICNLADGENGISGAIDNDYEIGILELMPVYTMNKVKNIDQFDEYDEDKFYLSDQRFIDDIKGGDSKYLNSSLLPGLRFAGYKPYIHTTLNQKDVIAKLDISKLTITIKMSAPILDYEIDGKSIHRLEPLDSSYRDFIKNHPDLVTNLKNVTYGKMLDEENVEDANSITKEHFASKNFEKSVRKAFCTPEARVSFAVRKNDDPNTLSKMQFANILDESIDKIAQNPNERENIIQELADDIEGKRIAKSPLETFAERVNSEDILRLNGSNINNNIDDDGPGIFKPFPNPDEVPSLRDAINVLKKEGVSRSGLKAGYIGDSDDFKEIVPRESISYLNLIPADLDDAEEREDIFDHVKSTDGYRGFCDIMKDYREYQEENKNFVFEKNLKNAFPSTEDGSSQNVLKIEQNCEMESAETDIEAINDTNASKSKNTTKITNEDYHGYFRPSDFTINTTFRIGIQISF